MRCRNRGQPSWHAAETLDADSPECGTRGDPSAARPAQRVRPWRRHARRRRTTSSSRSAGPSSATSSTSPGRAEPGPMRTASARTSASIRPDDLTGDLGGGHAGPPGRSRWLPATAPSRWPTATRRARHHRDRGLALGRLRVPAGRTTPGTGHPCLRRHRWRRPDRTGHHRKERSVKRTRPQLRDLLAMVLWLTLVAAAGPARAADELPAVDSGFGDYALVPLLGDEAAYAGPATPTSLDEVTHRPTRSTGSSARRHGRSSPSRASSSCPRSSGSSTTPTTSSTTRARRSS